MTQDRCQVCTERTIGSEIILDANDGILGDGVMWNLVSVHLEMVFVLVQDLHRTYHRLRKSFWMQTMELRGDEVMWNLNSVHLETVLVSVQDRCMVCARRTIGS